MTPFTYPGNLRDGRDVLDAHDLANLQNFSAELFVKPR